MTTEKPVKKRGNPNWVKGHPGNPKLENMERRRKDVKFGGADLKMTTPKIPGYKLRWINDRGTRIHDKTVLDDWDFVTKKEITIGGRVSVGDPHLDQTIDPGDRVSIPVGTKENGEPLRAYLCKKLQAWFEKDYAESQARIDEIEKGLYQSPKVEKSTGDIQIN